MSAKAKPGQADWFDDPVGRFESRYWDGTRWTQAVMVAGKVETDSEGMGLSEAQEELRPQQDPISPIVQQTALRTGAGRWNFSGSAVTAEAYLDRTTSLPAGPAQDQLCQMLALAGFPPIQVLQGRVDVMVTHKRRPQTMLEIFMPILPLLIFSRPVQRPVSLFLTPLEKGTRISAQGQADALELLRPIVGQLPW
jgi:hypothetical protein